MRILFLCSSLEPGRDGVGDYTQMVAQECARQGHDCALIALHDRHIAAPIEEARPVEPDPDAKTFAGTSSMPVLRQPAALPWPERVNRAVSFREHFKPDWFSLQFVPYGFNDKGVILGLCPRLQTIIGATPVHVMFHELWIGTARISPPRHLFLGAIQRHLVLRMLRKLRPAVIHTHAPVYASMLKHAGFQVSILPLFSNIVVSEIGHANWLWDSLAAVGCQITDETRDQFWLGGFFGTLHPLWQPEPFFGILRRAAQTAGKRVALLAIGRLGEGDSRWDEFARDYAQEFTLLKLGAQPVDKISQFLQIMDFGVAASPWGLIPKSSAAASMLEHGLPTIVTRDDFQARHTKMVEATSDPLLHRCDEALVDKLIAGLPKRPAYSRARDIIASFATTLERNTVTSASEARHRRV